MGKVDADQIRMNTLIGAAEPMIHEALRIFKKKPRTGEQLLALRSLEEMVGAIELWRLRGGSDN